jgi:hypothetical protein
LIISPRDATGCPLDRKLKVLGLEFASQIGSAYWRAALRTFHEIEKRTDLLNPVRKTAVYWKGEKQFDLKYPKEKKC